MKKIISLEERIEDKRQKERLEQYRGKIETIQKVLQCSACHLKCAMCGTQIEGSGGSGCNVAVHSGLQFCDSCGEEFREFLAIKKGQKEPDLFWHNKEWKEMWSAWLDYRKAMSAFLRSPEFKLLLEELNEQP
jgi:hypothetical protein